VRVAVAFDEMRKSMLLKDKRIAALEAALRKWRDHYTQSDAGRGMFVEVPLRQICDLVGEK